MVTSMNSAHRFASWVWTSFFISPRPCSDSLLRSRPASAVVNLQRKEYLSMNRNKRLSLLIFTLLVTASTAFAQPKKAAPPVKEYTIEQFMNTVRIGGSSFSSDEKSILFHNNKSGIFNVYSVPVTGGAATQLTNSTKESTFAVSYFPDRLALSLHVRSWRQRKQSPLPARARRQRTRSHARRESESELPRLESRSQIVLLLDQRTRRAFLRHL